MKLIKKIYNKLIYKSESQNNNLSFSSRMHKPFSLSDLNDTPQHWSSQGPNYVGIAAPKAGTSWWHSLLLEHPQVVENRLKTKELHYFPHFSYRGLSKNDISTYCMAFASPEGIICGEWSPGYFWYPLCIDYLYQVAPNTKLLIILRNPIDRAVSHLNQLLSNRTAKFNLDSDKEYILSIFSMYPEAILTSLYSYSLKRLLYYFSRDQILLLQYEKCKIYPEQEIAKTYRFLEIDDSYIPQKLKHSVNKTNYLISSLSLEERQRLANYFADDVKTTINLFPEIDLSLWQDFQEIDKKYSL